jgi:hypothetical protein
MLVTEVVKRGSFFCGRFAAMAQLFSPVSWTISTLGEESRQIIIQVVSSNSNTPTSPRVERWRILLSALHEPGQVRPQGWLKKAASESVLSLREIFLRE